MEHRNELNLDIAGIRAIALEFREAILNEDRPRIVNLCKDYNPHFVHAAFEESAEYPGEINVFRFARDISEGSEAPFSDDFKNFLMHTVLR